MRVRQREPLLVSALAFKVWDSVDQGLKELWGDGPEILFLVFCPNSPLLIQSNMTPTNRWFMIKSVLDGSIISCDRSQSNDFLRSQVYVYPTPHYVDAEYWRWNGSFIENKKTGLVLDIRKGTVLGYDNHFFNLPFVMLIVR